jgi:quinone-reactive Ni/Fe-hydrogenase small subunit
MAIDRRALFASTMGPKAPFFGLGYDPALLSRSEKRLDELAAMQPLSGLNLKKLLADNGISRRTFLKWVSAATALLMLPPKFEPLVAKAAAVTNRIPVIWLETQSCTGNSEALLRAAGPTIDELIFNVISLEYAEVLMAASGFQAEQRLQDTIKAYRGKYILIVEGSIPQGLNGAYGTIGPSGTTFIERVRSTAGSVAPTPTRLVPSVSRKSSKASRSSTSRPVR